MPPMSRWLENWRSIAVTLEPGRYSSITITFREEVFEVLLLSLFDPDVDGDATMVITSSRDFDNNVSLFSRRTRDTGVGRVITNKGRPRFVLEQGRSALQWGAAIEGVTLDRWMAATRESHSWRGIERVAKREWRQRLLHERRSRAIESRIEELAEEKQLLEGLLLATRRRLRQLDP